LNAPPKNESAPGETEAAFETNEKPERTHDDSPRVESQALTTVDVAEILAACPTRPAYIDWVGIIAAVGSVLTESEAVAILSAWSPEESQGEYARKLRNRCQRVGIGSLIERAKAHGFDARAFARRRADRGSVRRQTIDTPELATIVANEATARAVTKVEQLPTMPDRVRAVWDEGVDQLHRHPETAARIDTWRGWPPGTAATLADDGLLASPVTYGSKRGLAFPVQAPERCEFGFVQTRQNGYHVRHKPTAGERATWSFHPNESRDGQSTPGLPFVIGAGFCSFAKIVVVTEGQFDAITLAAAGGWLANDAAWPEHITLFGTRGAAGWRNLWTHWRPFLPAGVAFTLFPDADEAGSKWTSPGGFRDTLRDAGHPVRVIRSRVNGAKDINDLHRIAPITTEQISVWLGRVCK